MPDAATLDTLGSLAARGYTISGWCPEHGFRDVDLPTLIERLGADWVFIGKRIPVKCAVCGRPLETQIHPPTPGADMVQSSGMGR